MPNLDLPAAVADRPAGSPPRAAEAGLTASAIDADATRSDRLLRWVAVFTAVAAAVPFALEAATDPAMLARPRAMLWLAAFASFVGLFWLPERKAASGHESCGSRSLLFLAAHSALAVALVWLMPVTLYAVFLVIVAAELGEALRPPAAVAWTLALSLAVAPVFVRTQGWREGLVVLGAFIGFELFAVYALHAAGSERRARVELAAANAELRHTRARLAATSRAAERLRIARDLHDVMGHHLTALSLNLEAARHATADQVPGYVDTAQGLARRLLGEVRRVVDRLRDGETAPPDLADALAALAVGIERPRLHLQVADDLRRVADPERAAALLRCAQEIVTNAVRHSGAENLWIELARAEGGIFLAGRDDGRGALGLAIESGHGLRGMGERMERLGGRLDVTTRPGEGFEVRAWLPG